MGVGKYIGVSICVYDRWMCLGEGFVGIFYWRVYFFLWKFFELIFLECSGLVGVLVFESGLLKV